MRSKAFLMDYASVVLHNEQVILLNNLKSDIVSRYNEYNNFEKNYTFKSVDFINVYDIAFNVRNNERVAILTELKKDILERSKIARCKELAKHDKKVTISIVKRAERETVKTVDRNNDVSVTWKCTVNNCHVFNFDNFIYLKIVQYAKNKMRGLNYVEGEFTLDFIVNGIYTKYIELLLNDNKLISIYDATIGNKINALVHTFALIKKSLALLNFGTSAKYTENEKTTYSVFYGDALQKIETNKNNIEYGNTRAMNTKHVTIIDLLKQWETRSNNKERAFYTYDDGENESSYFADDNYDVMTNLVINSARDIVKNIIQNTPDYERIKNIIQFNLTDKKELMYLKRWKEKNKINELSRDDLYYLFIMNK